MFGISAKISPSNKIKSTIVFLALLICLASAQDVNLKQVRCLVCRTIIDEFVHDVNKLDPKKQIEVGQYRLDPKGNTLHKKLPLAMSEIHLSDMLEKVCKRMEDYVRATYKSNGKLTLLKLMTDGGLNPLMNEVDIVQDGDLNKSLEYYCAEVVNEYEDDIIEVISKKQKNAKSKICSEYCGDFADDSDDDEDDEAKDNDDGDNEDDDYSKTEL